MSKAVTQKPGPDRTYRAESITCRSIPKLRSSVPIGMLTGLMQLQPTTAASASADAMIATTHCGAPCRVGRLSSSMSGIMRTHAWLSSTHRAAHGVHKHLQGQLFVADAAVPAFEAGFGNRQPVQRGV